METVDNKIISQNGEGNNRDCKKEPKSETRKNWLRRPILLEKTGYSAWLKRCWNDLRWDAHNR